MELDTVGKRPFWSCTNLAMAHAAVGHGAVRYGRVHYKIRARLFNGLSDGSMGLGSLGDDERLKMVLPQACWCCGRADGLSADHLIARSCGGPDSGENLVWACRGCNRSKRAADVLDWLAKRGEFPPLLLLRRYLKLAIAHCAATGSLELAASQADTLPFSLAAVPRRFPPPGELVLWRTPLPDAE